jgi:hypothetical protein
MGMLDRWRKQPPPRPDVAPRSAAGRGHTQGFIDAEETNNDLLGISGLEIFDKMYRTDGDVRQVVQLVANPLISGTWVVNPYGGAKADEKAQKHAEIVEWALFEQMTPNLIGHLIEMLPLLIRSGFVPYEALWMTAERDGKTYIVPRKLDVRLPRTIERWYQDKWGELTSIIQQVPVPLDQLIAKGYGSLTASGRKDSNGAWLTPGEVEIKANNLVYYRLGSEGDNWEGTSLLRPAYKHWYMKDQIEKIDAIAQEKEAMGTPICYPPLGATPAQLDAMEAVLGAMRTNEQAYIIAPGPKAGEGAPEGQGWLVEVIGYDRTGSGRDPMPSLNYHTNKIAAAFISEFMRLGHGETGARATAQVQADPFLQSVEALATIIEHALNEQIVKPFVAYNLPDCENPPRLQMSLVDSTSLSQLADYVLKLTQIGAMLPDQELEDFLRARADLPPASPDSVKKRGKTDDTVRREIVTGGGGNGDAYGQNSRPALPHGTKTQKAKSSGAAKQMSYDAGEPASARPRYRELDENEHICDFDGVEDYLDSIPSMFKRSLGQDCYKLARGEIVAGLADNLHKCLEDAYDAGVESMHRELTLLGWNGGVTLASIRSHGRDGLVKRSTHGSRALLYAVSLASESAHMNWGDDVAKVQVASEKAVDVALRQAAFHHGQGAFHQGRHDALTLAAEQYPQVGFRYSAILDKNTCPACEDADDGIVRSVDDPVRMDRRPPNRHCHSTASGHNMCRCLEIPVLITE